MQACEGRELEFLGLVRRNHAFKAAKELFLRFRSGDESSAGTSTFMTWSDNAIYWRGKHDGPYVLKIACP